MTLLARSKAAEAELDRLVPPKGIGALNGGLALARTVTRRPELGQEAWRARLRPRLERLDHPSVIEVPRVRREDLSPEVLREATQCPTPVVFEGLIADSEAVRTWSPSFFRDNYGDLVVPMLLRSEGRNHLTIREIIDGFGQHSGNDAPQVNNVSDLILETPELRDAIPFDLIRSWSGEQLHGAQLFVGPKGCGTNYHCANEFNFFLMINGEKDWYLAHPRHSMWMDPLLDPRSGMYATATWERTTAWDEDPDGVPLMHVHLRPGDVLLNRPWWWHLVRNRTDAVGVSTRWHRWQHRFHTQNQLFTSLQWLVPHQWKMLWTDYVRGAYLTDDKFVKAFGSHHAQYEMPD